MKSLNKVQLIGYVGQEPKIMRNEKSVIAHVSLATSESYKEKEEWKERTEWHRLVFFNKYAENIEKYVSKGSRLFIEGSIRTNKFVDKEGNTKTNFDIIVSSFIILNEKKEKEVSTQIDFDSEDVPY